MMEAADLEEGEINAPGLSKAPFYSIKGSDNWEDNKENNRNFAGPLSGETIKRRKLREINRESSPDHSPMDIHIPSYPNVSKIDTYVPKYKTRLEWMQMMKERERRQRASLSKSRDSDERIFMEPSNEPTPKSGSEIISDEHSSTYSTVEIGVGVSLLDETSQDHIIWPSWLDPAGKYSAAIAPLPEFQPFIQEKKKQKLKQREELIAQLGDLYQAINVTALPEAKAVISGDGWKRQKDGTRQPNIAWQFIKDAQQPQDPRETHYLTKQIF